MDKKEIVERIKSLLFGEEKPEFKVFVTESDITNTEKVELEVEVKEPLVEVEKEVSLVETPELLERVNFLTSAIDEIKESIKNILTINSDVEKLKNVVVELSREIEDIANKPTVEKFNFKEDEKELSAFEKFMKAQEYKKSIGVTK